MLVSAVIILGLAGAQSQKCVPRYYKSSSVVCVCNSTYCDVVPEIRKSSKGRFFVYSSSREGLRFEKTEGKFTKTNNEEVVTIDVSKRFQQIIGFGGAFTDATGINVLSLSVESQRNLLRSYFSPDGVQYSLCRVPMGATDFSLKPYTYQDSTSLPFQLQEEDTIYKIPLIKHALNLTSNALKLIASPWTAPPWMKTRNVYSGVSLLNRQFYQMWADYYVKFFESYKKRGVSFWGLTTGNEPATGLTPLYLPTTGWFPADMAKWIAENLGPTIRNSNFSNLKIVVHDDQKLLLPLIQEIFRNDEAVKYADGVGVHWYWDRFTPTYFLQFAKTRKKPLFLLGTEASVGLLTLDPVLLGSWERAEDYIENIFEDLLAGVSGWIDWNMALNLKGGPVYTGFAVDSTIVVNATADEFYKQPIFYALGHFSKFLTPGSVRLHSTLKTVRNLLVVSFLRPDKAIIVTIYNKNVEDREVVIRDRIRGDAVVLLKGKSINNLIYW